MRNDKAEENESPRPPTEQTPFERFEEYVRKILAVPRSEIAEREKRYRRQRMRVRAKR